MDTPPSGINKFKERTYIIDKVLNPVNDLLRNKPISGILLFLAVVVALVWANSPFSESYFELWETNFRIGIGSFEINESLHHWINDGLMAIFFFVVGLEIKREIIAGDLSTWRKASLPIAAAVGGMLFPALIFLAFNSGGEAEAGWGVPMATDIAFTLGVLSLLGKRVPISLKLFLTALAIVDDLGAVLVIAFFYTDNLLLNYLEYGFTFFIILAVGNYIGVRKTGFYAVVGIIGLWTAFLLSGVHATLAGVLSAMTIPIKTKINTPAFVSQLRGLVGKLGSAPERKGSFMSDEQFEIIEEMKDARAKVEAPLQKLEHALNPVVSFVILPLFALSNAGLSLDVNLWDALSSNVSMGIMFGLIVGKLLGILSFSWLFVKLGISDLPKNTTWGIIASAGILAGIGFTMSLFITNLAFDSHLLIEESKMAILIGSLIAGVVGMLSLRYFLKKNEKKMKEKLETKTKEAS